MCAADLLLAQRQIVSAVHVHGRRPLDSVLLLLRPVRIPLPMLAITLILVESSVAVTEKRPRPQKLGPLHEVKRI